MLDNASGSATILNIAEKMKQAHPRNKLRFIWFGGEELGLLGSDYVSYLSQAELGRISYDLDADVTATPNYLIGVLDPAAPDLFGRTVTATFPANVYQPSKIAQLRRRMARPSSGRRWRTSLYGVGLEHLAFEVDKTMFCRAK